VRRLEAIESLGAMDVLCTDKTGTLTTGVHTLLESVDACGHSSHEVARLGYLNAALETGIDNPVDAAIREAGMRSGLNSANVRKIDEIPYDFSRRRLTIVVEHETGERWMITKGAFGDVASICSGICGDSEDRPMDPSEMQKLQAFVHRQGEEGVRVLAVAQRHVEVRKDYDIEDERDMKFAGFLLFADPPRPDAAETKVSLEMLGVEVKIVTGDNRYVAAYVANCVGLDPSALLTGSDIRQMTDEALWHQAARTHVFAEIDPQQKERIVHALQRTGLSVGYLGDGINDAPALHAADVGISVEGAVDVAREGADVVLLRPDLDVLRLSIEEGRRTFANILKYIYITTSANFGNMISMAVATPFLPFLPLLPKQILLNNFISDLPSVFIAADKVDAEEVCRPVQWNLRRLQVFMVTFGLLSSAFDLLTFAMLLHFFRSEEPLFQTGWFMVSLLTELVVVMILRTGRPTWRSCPGRILFIATILAAAITLSFPFVQSIRGLFGFVSLSIGELGALAAIIIGYVAATEVVKFWFVRN
jgi:Mg2+-importing ATPase